MTLDRLFAVFICERQISVCALIRYFSFLRYLFQYMCVCVSVCVCVSDLGFEYLGLCYFYFVVIKYYKWRWSYFYSVNHHIVRVYKYRPCSYWEYSLKVIGNEIVGTITGVYQFARFAVTKSHRAVGMKSRNLSSSHFWRLGRSRMRCQQVLVPSEGSEGDCLVPQSCCDLLAVFDAPSFVEVSP